MVVALQTCSTEILDMIMSHLPRHTIDHVDGKISGKISDLIACSLTCRTLSKGSQPYIFKAVFLEGTRRTQPFLELIALNPKISIFVTELCIAPATYRRPQRCWIPNDLLLWLGFQQGFRLISKLSNVRTLSLMGWNLHKDTQEDNDALDCISQIRSATTLQLHSCSIPLRRIVQLCTQAYSALQILLCFNSRVANAVVTNATSESHETKFVIPHLRRLAVDGIMHNMQGLVSSLSCAHLISLHVRSAIHVSEGRSRWFKCIQGILSQAHSLEYLKLVGCSSIPIDETLSLRGNTQLQSLKFVEIIHTNTSNSHWLSGTVETLAEPTKLRTLELQGDQSWEHCEALLKSLDQTLSHPRFTCLRGERAAVPTGLRRSTRRVPSTYATDNLTRTPLFSWFTIKYPAFRSSGPHQNGPGWKAIVQSPKSTRHDKEDLLDAW